MSSVDRYFERLAAVVTTIDGRAVDRLIDRIRGAGERGGTIYVLGNGGSATTASHMALDLAKNARRTGQPGLRVFSLTDNVGLVTAWANDSHYDQVFAAQLEPLVRSGDVLVAVSASGRSPNVLAAVRTANRAGACSFGVTGGTGGTLVAEATDCVVVRSDDVQLIEDAHLAIVHAVTAALRDGPESGVDVENNARPDPVEVER